MVQSLAQNRCSSVVFLGCSSCPHGPDSPSVPGRGLALHTRLDRVCSSILAFLSHSDGLTQRFAQFHQGNRFLGTDRWLWCVLEASFPQRPVFSPERKCGGLEVWCLWPRHLGVTPRGQNPGLMTPLCPVPRIGPGPRDHQQLLTD